MSVGTLASRSLLLFCFSILKYLLCIPGWLTLAEKVICLKAMPCNLHDVNGKTNLRRLKAGTRVLIQSM